MAQVDAALRQTVDASIAYNKPEAMGLGETATVELLMNPSLAPDVLSTQLTEPGSAASTSIQITPRMKATLMADDQTAFDIRAIHDNPEQFISQKETTKWSWLVTARKGGNQGLTLTIDRLLQIQGIDQWREVETYRANIEVKVTFVQTLQSLDWKWIIGLIIPLIGVPSLWQYLNSRKKKGKTQAR